MSNKILKIYNHRNFQLIFMGLFFFFFFSQTFVVLQQFNAEEKTPTIFPNIPDQHRPFGQGITTVNAGIFIKSMPTFDIREELFEIVGTLWFEFNPNLVSLTDIGAFQFENGSLISKSEARTKFIGHRAFVTYDVRIKFISNLVQKLFPLNDHRIFLILKNDKLSPQEIHYEVDEKGVSFANFVQPKGWQPLNNEARTGYLKTALDHQDLNKTLSSPGIIFAFSFVKPGFRYIFEILGPSIILFSFGLLVLLIHRNSTLQFPIVIGSLSGLVIYRFVIESMVPNVGSFTLTDYLYLVFLFSIFILLIVSVYEVEEPLSKTFKSTLFYVLQILALITFLFLSRSIK